MRSLFRAYADSLDIDLGFQDFEAELAGLPGKYAAPAGRILLARQGDQAVGCIALRPLQDGGCEMKRLYVRPDMRGERLGRRLAERLCQEARDAGYTHMCLDTLSTMSAAVALYTSLGFKPTEAYVFNPIPDALYFKLAL